MATRKLWKYSTCLFSAVPNFAKNLNSGQRWKIFINCLSLLKKKTKRSAWGRSRVLLDVLTCVLERFERTSLLQV